MTRSGITKLLRFAGLINPQPQAELSAINRRRDRLSAATLEEFKSAIGALRRPEPDVVETYALAAEVAHRLLGMRMFDVQLLCGLTLNQGHIAEMETGEGKTLAAVPAVIWYALHGRGVHVLTANDYLAKRDASWMGGIYSFFGLSVAHISQDMSAEQRRAAYASDITYATANEIGFDFLRDGLAETPEQLVHRSFAFAVIDEADSALIDEARIPLVIAGGRPDDPAFAYAVDAVVRSLRRYVDYFPDEFARNVQLTDSGIGRVERTIGCGNLFDEQNLRVLTAVQDALHAHVLLRRDIDYVVKNGAAELVDEFKGRIAQNRRWPAGLQSAIEAKEGLALKTQGRILGSITVQSLVRLYERVCGMTGTAVTESEEFWKTYRLPVTVIPTNRPLIRQDLPDVVYADKASRNRAVIEEIRTVYTTGRPILIGTASVEDSELLSSRLHAVGIPHNVLNARNDEAEAAIIAQAGALHAVTISTNMAGRGTDILLGGSPPVSREAVVSLGGLYVLGTTRHEARRIDNQLRGRAGRQGDPGSSRFFLSHQDDLFVRFGIAQNPDIDSVQRTAESQNFEIRQLLAKYDSLIEHHRRETYARRREVLLSSDWSVEPLLPEERYNTLLEAVGVPALQAAGRRLVLTVIDDLWADYLANVTELRGGIHWVSWGGRDPLYEFLTGVEEIYSEMQARLEEDVSEAFATAVVRDGQIRFRDETQFERGATWTYLTTDQPFGTLGERIVKGLRRKFSRRR